jgi:uncharacterized protein (TIGR03435 family)
VSGKKCNPPTLAIWWLRHACPSNNNDALTGDLIERFGEGQTRGWFWRQVLIAFAVGVRGEIRRHWPHFSYAIAGTVTTCFFRDSAALTGIPAWLHWQDLPWPWSQFAAELSRTAVLALAPLFLLAAGLAVERSFRWISLLRAGAINLTLIAFGHYSTDFFPWLCRPVPGEPGQKFLIVPPVMQVLLFFSAFLVAAWLGCRKCTMRALRGFTFLVLLSGVAIGQSVAKPAFDLAGVHVSSRGDWSKTPAHAMQGGFLTGDRYELHRATILDMIRIAYGVDADKVYGGPNWLDYDRFEVIAKTKPGTRPETLQLMLQTLLEDRFHLAAKPGTRPVPGYVLSKGKPELKLRAAAANETSTPSGCMTMPRIDGGPPSPGIQCHNATMAALAQILRRIVSPTGNAPLVDSTGIEGGWDFDLSYERQPGLPAVSMPSLLDGLDKIGLRLEPGQIPQPVLDIESVNERPSPDPPDVAARLPSLPAPEFEVASLKWPCKVEDGPMDPHFESGGRVTATCVPLVSLIKQAWNVPAFEQPVGIPRWLVDDNSSKYNVSIVAKAPAGIAPDPEHNAMARDILNTMLRKLLMDRYKMAVHYEDRPTDTYTLVAVKPKLTKADPANRTGCVRQNQRIQGQSLIIRLVCKNITTAQFAEQIQAYDLDASYPVLDGTAIAGSWDFTLTYDAYAGLTARFPQFRGPAPADGQAAEPSVAVSFAGALEKELGLKLEAHKRPLLVLVIDHMEEKPLEN